MKFIIKENRAENCAVLEDRATCSKELLMSATTENAVVEESVREMQNTSSVVHGTASDPAGAIKSQPSVANVRTACERQNVGQTEGCR